MGNRFVCCSWLALSLSSRSTHWSFWRRVEQKKCYCFTSKLIHCRHLIFLFSLCFFWVAFRPGSIMIVPSSSFFVFTCVHSFYFILTERKPFYVRHDKILSVFCLLGAPFDLRLRSRARGMSTSQNKCLETIKCLRTFSGSDVMDSCGEINEMCDSAITIITLNATWMAITANGLLLLFHALRTLSACWWIFHVLSDLSIRTYSNFYFSRSFQITVGTLGT